MMLLQRAADALPAFLWLPLPALQAHERCGAGQHGTRSILRLYSGGV